MKDSLDLSALSSGLSDPKSSPTGTSSAKHVCTNELIIRNQPYFISMIIHQTKQIQLDLEVEAKESADVWKSSFDVAGILLFFSR